MSKEVLNERAVLVPVWDKPEPFFLFSEVQKEKYLAARLKPWRIAPDDKRVPVHKQASTCDSLLEISPEAITVGSPFGTVPLWWGIFGILIGLFGVIFSIQMMMAMPGNTVLVSISGLALVLFFLVSMFFLRMALLSPRDFPVMFNRKSREIFYFTPSRLPFFKFWRGVKFLGESAAWENVKVRSYKYAEFTSRTARDSYSLSLIFGKNSDFSLVKSIVDIGYKGEWEDERLFRLWEHIRQYMEEDGPPIQPGENLRTIGHGKLPKFPADIIAASGGPALSSEEVARVSGKV